VNLSVDPQLVIDELSMQVAQLVRDNTVLKVQNTSLITQLQEKESAKEGEVRDDGTGTGT
jgi:regulator of replication initiation timing